MMQLSTEVVTVNLEFEPAELFQEIIREMINEPQGPAELANAILDGTDQLFGDELVEILDEITDILGIAAMNNRDDGDDE